MASSTIQPVSFVASGDFPNGESILNVRNGWYRVLANGATPSEGLPSGFAFCTMIKLTAATGYTMAILTDIYGKLAVWSTQNNAWVTH